MKKLFLALAVILTLTLTGTSNAFASVNDFSFESFEADYYLTKDTASKGNLKIEETLIASFATQNQNHGIERCIPTRYRDTGTISSSFTVLQDGLAAAFSERTTSDGFTCLRIGDANKYVYGEVEYKISYTYSNVIVSYADTGYQELYWDTNGTSWSQPFGSLTARLHIPDDIYSTLQPDQKLVTPFSCYVGSYGESGSSRCQITESTDLDGHVVTFKTGRLSAGENLTMNAMFKADTFSAIVQTKSYLLIAIAIVATLIMGGIIAWLASRRNQQSEKIKLAKDKAVPVQYVPMRGLTVAEMGTNYLKSTSGSLNVASLIELATSHKIELEKGEKKRFGGYHWKIHVKDLNGISEEQEIVLKILNGGDSVAAGDTIEVKKHTATARLQLLARSFTEEIENSLIKKGLREDAKKSSGIVIGIVLIIFILMFTFPSLIISLISSGISSFTGSGNTIYIGAGIILAYLPLAFVAFIVTSACLASSTHKYKTRTIEGIKASKYLDGLKEYMQLAEAGRLKFLQSVEGADTTHNGVVKLYERLLPYAILFGIEESWMSELNKYYQMADVSDPTWVTHGVLLSSRDFRTFNTYTASTISSSTMSSSSGSSSGFSGGGGGGFSGGGGGGGGGGGW